MKFARHKKSKNNRLDLVHKARLLGCTASHLARVISGERRSASLLNRLQNLMEFERTQKNLQTTNP
jgi:hypothetical protein